MVDQDLDFVIRAGDKYTDNELPRDGSITPNTWIKAISMQGPTAGPRLGPTETGLTVVYPTHTDNYPLLNLNDHLPNLDEEQVVSNVAKEEFDAESGRYENAGRPPRNEVYPFGIPNNESGQPIAGSDSAGYRRGLGGFRGDTSRWYQDFSIPRGSALGQDSDKFGVSVNDILNTLPDDFERGFFSSVAFADADFNGGAELNEGLTKFIAEEFIHLFQNERRVAVRGENVLDFFASSTLFSLIIRIFSN